MTIHSPGDKLPEDVDLLVRIVQKNYDDYASTTKTLIDNLTEQVAQLQATVDAIRDGVEESLSGKYMPTPAHVRMKLYPDKEFINSFREGKTWNA